MKVRLGDWLISEYISSLVRGLGGSHMAPGSENGMVSGENFVRAFRGVTALVGKVGSRLLFNTDQSYAGLGTATVNGLGSLFNVRQLLCYIGAGQVSFAGLALAGIIASSTLSLVKKSGGVYAAGALTGPFQAGHAQPSAPTIYPKNVPSAGTTPMSASVAVKIWRISNITGQVSLASLPSNVLVLNNQTAIAQIPLPDANGQTHWGIGVPPLGYDVLGVFYELPTSLHGEVAEADLAYTRAAGSTTFTNASDTVEIVGGVTAADIGRRISNGSFDTWITSIVDGTHAKINDIPGATTTAAGTVTHAVDGYTRAIEISWTNGALQKQNVVPDKAFPPPAGQFAGSQNDVLWLDADGIIYVGEPGQIGSFPPSNAIFANEPAVHYLPGIDGVTLRFGKHSWGALSYVGGSPALEYQELSHTLGIAYPQNVAFGARGRLMAWFGKPSVVESGIDPDYGYATKVMPDFDGWDEGQTVDAPIVPGYDARGEYEVWCWQKKVMAKYVPKDAWCSPIDLTGKVSGNIVSAVTHEKQLYLTCSDGADLTIYQFDVGNGSVLVIQTSDIETLARTDMISEVYVQGNPDNTDNNVRVELIGNYDDANPILISDLAPPQIGTQHLSPFRPDILGAITHCIRVTMTSIGNDGGIDKIRTYGERSAVIVNAGPVVGAGQSAPEPAPPESESALNLWTMLEM